MRRMLAGLALVALVAAGGLGYWLFRPRQLTFEVEASLEPGVIGAVTISADGRDVGTYRPGPIRFRVPGRVERRYSQRMLPEFKARALRPCGSSEFPISAVKPRDADLAKAGAEGVPARLALALSQPAEGDQRVAILWVDNLEHAQVRLAVGQDERTIEAGTKREEHFLVEDCALGRRVTLDGRPIGELPDDIRPSTAGSVSISIDSGSGEVLPGDDFLVDTSAAHCYRLGEQYYGRSSNAGLGYAPAYSTTLKPASFRRLPPMALDFFLEKPPRRLEISVAPGMENLLQTRNYLYRVGCGELEE